MRDRHYTIVQINKFYHLIETYMHADYGISIGLFQTLEQAERLLKHLTTNPMSDTL